MTMSPLDRAKVLREAGRVERCHTLPHHGSYTVGQHSFDAACLLLCLHPSPSLDLVRAILWHDAPERWIGDTPVPALWADPEFAAKYAQLEELCLERAGLKVQLTQDEMNWLRVIDKAELLLWTFEQMALGNFGAKRVATALQGWLERNKEIIPPEVQTFLETYVPVRSPDAIPPAEETAA